MKNKTEKWIHIGYRLFAFKGIEGLKIEALAKEVGISKSSFYHYFSDIELFTEKLFEHHYKRCKLLSNKEQSCSSINPDLINILLEHRADLLFHRQIRINRNQSIFNKAFIKSNKILGNYAVMIWAREININFTRVQLEGLFEIATDDFYMRINPENITFDFLLEYFRNLNRITKQLV